MKRLLVWLFRRRRIDDELREEIDFHMQMRAELNRASGMTPEEAERASRKQFGNATLVQEDTRRIHVNAFLETLGQDLRHALRSFLRTPAFAVTVIVALALGIGATTAVFSVVDLLLFRSLPYADAERLVSLGVVAPIEQNEFMFGATYAQVRQGLQGFEAFTSWNGVSDCDITEENPVRTKCARVESNFLPMLGMNPALGRHFTQDDDQTNGPRVAAISYALWRSRFGGDLRTLGKPLRIDGQPWEIVAVLSPDFELPNLTAVDVVMPQRYEEARLRRQTSGPIPPLRVFGRLKPRVSIAQAEAELQPLFQESLKDVPREFWSEVKLKVRSMRDRQIQDAKVVSWILLGAVAAVLMIACANVANLMLARSISRQRELAMRAALGASRSRLIRQGLTESLLLGVAGGAVGCGLAFALLKALVAVAPEGIQRLQQASIDPRVLVFTLVISICSGVLFGLTPALESPRPERLSGWRTVGVSRHRLRQGLVVAQIAGSLVLLVGATLLLRTLWNMQNAQIGMRSDSTLVASVSLGPQQYPQPSQCLAFFDRLETKLRETPAFRQIAIADSLPPSGSARTHIFAGIQVEGQPRQAQSTGGMVVWRYVTPTYFQTLGIPILRGRGFLEEERNLEDSNIILSDRLARRLFPNRDPIGQRVELTRDAWFTIIGIAANVTNGGLVYPDDPEYYLLRKHNLDRTIGEVRGTRTACSASIVARTSDASKPATDLIRTSLANIDPTIPLKTEMLDDRVYKLTARQRFNAVLLGLFANIGVLLAAIGLYGVISFLVAERTQEIGVRMALGATSGNIVRLVFSHAIRWVMAGILFGLAGSLLATRSLRSLLYEVPERDPWTFSLTLAVLLAVAFLAAWIPSRRASRVDPLVALRQE
jgi:predicted permease